MPTSSIVDEYDAHFEPYRWAVYINTALSIPLNILAVYLIWYKSPKHLGKYKYVLLNISLWVFLADLVDEVIFLPLPLMEVFAFSTSGLASALGPNGGFACLVACICCVAESLASLLLAFIYRCSALKGGFDIFGKRLEHRHYWIGSFVLMTVPAGSMMAGTVICYVSQDEFRERVLKVRPDFKPFFDSFPVFGLNERAFIMAGVILFWTVMWMFFVTFCIWVILKQFRIHRANMSNFTYSLHIQLLKSLTVQALTPVVLCAIPISLLMISFICGWTIINDMFKLTELTMSLHSSINSLAVILLIRPYRNAVVVMFRKFQGTQVSVIAKADVPTRSAYN